VILDFVGAGYWNDNLASLAIGGRLMLIGYLGGTSEQLDIGAVLPKSLTITGTTLRRTPLDKKIQLTHEFGVFGLERLERGELRPIIDSVYPLSDASAAHTRMQSNQNLGKIILTVT
jgi:NADPH:quinone reductase-like Zn-dependent oxidoreductase